MFLAIYVCAHVESSRRGRIFGMKALLYSGTKNCAGWAMRGWVALREAGVVFGEEVVHNRRPQRFANLDRIGAFSPPAMVPALVVDQTVIFDSVAIMAYANEEIGRASCRESVCQYV